MQERRCGLNKLFRKESLAWGFGVALLVCMIGILLLLQGPNAVANQKTQKKKIEHQKAFAVYQKKCLGCHDSVADPEKPGRTRDDWFMVVNIMHGYGMDLTDQEAESITNLLYDLRSGLEKDAG
jgi:hypothetical protein